jgi:phospholipase/carboxylesterase
MRYARFFIFGVVALALNACEASTASTSSTTPPKTTPGGINAIVIEPLSPPATSMLVLLHGLGDNARSFSSVGRALQASLPQTVIVVPDAIEAFDGGRDGRQWFSFKALTPERRVEGVGSATAVLSPWIDARLAERHIAPEKLMVLGFSQGAMVANRLALERTPPPRRTVGIGGMLAVPPVVLPTTHPHVLVIHGEDDERIAVDQGRSAAAELQARGAVVELAVIPGLGHRIDEQVLRRTATFLKAP